MKNLNSAILFCICIFCASFSQAESTPGLELRVEYVQEKGKPLAVVLLDIRPPYHAYAHNPGSVGLPATLTAAFPGATRALPVWYPAGTRQADIFDPSAMVRIYEGPTPLFVDLDGLPSEQILEARLELLLCSPQHCLPVNRVISLALPQEPLPQLQTTPWNRAWQALRGTDPVAAPLLPNAPTAEQESPLPVPPSAPGSATSFPAKPFPRAGSGAAMALPAGEGGGPAVQGFEAGQPGTSPSMAASANALSPNWAFTPRYFHEGLEVSSLGKALLLGLLAGLLLNAMPCVLPVLTLKMSSVLVLGEAEDTTRLRRFREHNIFFALGILTFFVALSLILGSAERLWGQLFQSPSVVFALLCLVFLLGLSMFGLFTLPMLDLKAGTGGSPRSQAYVTGILATLLATPCSGPLLGGVLGWAFTQPLAALMLVFVAVGCGMSLPYAVFTLRPSLARLLPRPGPWLGVLERLVGFFLLGTALYLLSLLPNARLFPVLVFLLVLACCGWIWGHFCGYGASLRRRAVCGAVLALVLLGALWGLFRPAEEPVRWESFSPTSFQALLGKEPLLVEFTADWCPNCKFLEQTTLTPSNVRRWKKNYGLRLVRVDLTRPDPQAQSLLQALGSASIPLTALFPPGPASATPLVLRDIYTPAALETALKKTLPR